MTSLFRVFSVDLVRRGESEHVDLDVKIVAVDIQQMAPLPGVIQIQGDITKVSDIFPVSSCVTMLVSLDINCTANYQSL